MRALLVGVVAGFLSGLFGVGGGILIVPGLVLLAHMEQRRAHGTSLAAIIPIAISGVVGYVLDDKVDWTATLFLAVGAVAGAVIGTRLLQILPQRTLRLAFALVLFATAVRLLLDEGNPTGRGALDVKMSIAFVALGLGTGVLSGLLGVGGGIVMVPVMIILFHMPGAVAKATSLAVIIPTSLVGTARNVRSGNADVRIAAIVGLAGVATAFMGARVSIGLSDDVSAALFSALLVVLAVRMLLEDRTQQRRARGESAHMILQPDEGSIAGTHYLRSTEETVRWGLLPARDATPVLRVRSGAVVTIDTVSHEGVLEDFDRDPVGWFGAHGVAREAVLRDAIDVAASVPHAAGVGPARRDRTDRGRGRGAGRCPARRRGRAADARAVRGHLEPPRAGRAAG